MAAVVDVFRKVRRVLRDDGTLWLNLGDSYAHTRGGKDRRAMRTWLRRRFLRLLLWAHEDYRRPSDEG